MDWTALIAGGILSLITGVLTWWITDTRARLDEVRRIKRELLVELVANRYDLTRDAFSRALNASAVVYADSPAVKSAINKFHKHVVARDAEAIQAALLETIRSMYEHLKLTHGDLTDDFLLRPFNTRPASAVPRRIE